MQAPEYLAKFETIQMQTLYHLLSLDDRERVFRLADDFRFTQQDLRRFVEFCLDFAMWNQESPFSSWQRWHRASPLTGKAFKQYAFRRFEQLVVALVDDGIQYDEIPELPTAYKKTKIKKSRPDEHKKIFGMCPVYSEKTLCCNLRTIDAVKNCGFGCSYCSIQTMFTGDEVFFDDGFTEKLQGIQLDPKRHYHIGTGQSSDALMWGNKNGILDSMFEFARKWPRALIEFKTKSKNIRYFLNRPVPENIVCSWSLNPDGVIANEEHLTASMKERLDAARRVADQGIKVAFHFHPMIYFSDWQQHYAELMQDIQCYFSPQEVLFVSFGTLTFPKPVLKKIRGNGIQSQILRMPMVANPEGKMTYPDDIKIKLFTFAFEQFQHWHERVFFYLCMEEKRHWLTAFGFDYENNDLFEQAFHRSVWAKITPGIQVNTSYRSNEKS